jgi:penicillin-insensitive murein endopeptidase
MRARPVFASTLLCLAALASALLCVSALAPEAAAKGPELPPEFRRAPWTSRTLSVGAPNDGRLVRGRRLEATAALRLWNGNDVPAYATPQLLRVLARAAGRVRAAHPGSAVVVHALSREEGGPIHGKRSHRSGRDADLVLFARDAKGKPAVAKKLARFGTGGRTPEGLVFDDARNWALVDALARDHAVTHLFIASALRVRLLAHARAAKVENARVERVAAVLFADDGDEPLDALLHVRVVCPEGQEAICAAAPR